MNVTQGQKLGGRRLLVAGVGFALLSGCLMGTRAWADTSQLWGRNGAVWSAQGRIPDYSFAGYHSGDAPIPTVEVKGNVRDFGAKGDGVSDDTEAFKRAIAATNDGALLIPAGRYLLSDMLTIGKSNLVLRGEGAEKTVLFFSKSLEEIKPAPTKNTGGTPTSNYSWSGGLIRVEGKQTGAEVGVVKTRAARGTQVIELEAAPTGLKSGQKIEIRQTDADNNTLLQHLYAGQTGDTREVTKTHTSFVSRVERIQGNKLWLQRTLRTDISPQWKATVRVFAPSVTEVGIEDLGFDFPRKPYRGHFTEVGYNPLTFPGAADCWARNLRIFNADSGPFISGTFISVENVVFDADRTADKAGEQGHHGFTVGTDTLFRGFDFRIKFVHDISAEDSAAGNVIADGKGVDLCFDSHKRFPHANLYTNIDIGKGNRMYSSGGGNALGRNSAAWTTFWNIRAARPQAWPPTNYAPDMITLVGVQTDKPAQTDKEGRWFEPLTAVEPTNLYDAQMEWRHRDVVRF
ncbi:hypothetical protein EON83_26550 [bacterium]|nr:MAG: hypothetical protein EON83_26550 [bacterium]